MKQTLYAAVFTAVVSLVPSTCYAQTDYHSLRPLFKSSCEFWNTCRYNRWVRRQAELRTSYRTNYGREGWDDYYRRQGDWGRGGHWPTRAQAPSTGRRCHPALLMDHSRPHKSEKAAVAQAWEHWMIQVMGEPGANYMDPDNSTDRYVHCALASVGTGFLGGVDKWRGKVIQYAKGEESAGQADGLYRVCYVWARPCRDGAEPIGHEGVLRKSEPPRRRR